jgi:hypothetical protein
MEKSLYHKITQATTVMQAVLLFKRTNKLSGPLDYDPTTDTTMVC